MPATIALVGVVFGLGPGGPRPELAVAADRLVDERLAAADAAVAEVQELLAEAIEVGRNGAAAIIAGDGAPSEHLTRAVEQVLAAAAASDGARAAVRAADGALRARDREVAALPAGVEASELGSVAIQLERTVEAADTFAQMRRRASNVPVALEASLSAITDGRLDAAAEHLATAEADRAAVATWEAGGAALDVWLDVTEDTVDAIGRLIEALVAGDTTAAERAADDFAALADDATQADRGLQITISEEGANVVSAPLARLADAKRVTDAQRAAIARVAAGG